MNFRLCRNAVVVVVFFSLLSGLHLEAAGTLLPYSRNAPVHETHTPLRVADFNDLKDNPSNEEHGHDASRPSLQNLNSEWSDTKKLSQVEMLQLLIPEMKLPLEKIRLPGGLTSDRDVDGIKAPTTQALKLTKFEALNVFVPSTPDQMPRMNRILIPEFPRVLSLPDANSSHEETQHAAQNGSGNFTSPLRNEIRLANNSQVSLMGNHTNILRNESSTELAPDFPHDSTVTKENKAEIKGNDTKLVNEINVSSIEDLLDLINMPEQMKSTHPAPLNELVPPFPSFLLNASNILRTTSFLPTPLPSSGNKSAPSKTNEKKNDITENVSHIRKGYPDAVDAFSILLKNLGLSYDVANPEIDVFNPNQPTLAQTEIGAKCVTSDPKEAQGVCVPLEECPALSNLIGQTELLHSALYLYSNICRFQGSRAFYCCPLYTFSSALPGSLLTLVRPPQASPVRTSIPGPEECGRVRTNRGKVAGGGQVKDGEWPWLAALGVPVSEARLRLTCTGALVTNRHVISAAHCFYSSEAEKPSHVRLGDTDLKRNTVPLHQDYIIISRTFPLYHKHVSINDLVILTLDREVLFNDFVLPACLPYDFVQAPQPGDNVTAVGFGRNSARVPISSPFPNAVELQVLENSFCQQAYYSSRNFPILDHRTFCAGGSPDMGTCEGDSGGPLHVYDGVLNRYVVVGLVKGGGGCGTPDLPSVNTRLGPYLPWIETVLKKREPN
ncbi:Serine proteases trypsin domain [Trinorchestia longiramus]|nr:Serine proteases trypsin domain [Trinorchestia longiramus]